MPHSSYSSSEGVYCPTLHDYWALSSSASSIYLNLAQLLLCHPQMDKTAVASPDGDLTYRQLLHETCRTASALEQRGIQPEERVLIALDDDHMQLCLTLGCWAVGAIPVLTHPQFSGVNFRQIVNDIMPTLCIVRSDRTAEAHAALENASTSTTLLSIPPHVFLTEKDWRLIKGDPFWRKFYLCSSKRMQCIQYSSGTTGAAKGVMHSAQGLLDFIRYQMVEFLGFLTEDIFYTVPRTFFSYGILLNLTTPLSINATTIRDSRWPTPEKIIENIQRYRPSMLLGVPLHFQSILDNAAMLPQNFKPRFLLAGGAPLSHTLIQRWYDTYGTWIHDALGLSETLGLIATTYPHSPLECSGVGYITPSCTTRLLDKNQKTVDLGALGELWVHNDFLAIGYWNNPSLTAERFHRDENGQRWYATGDIFREDEHGCLHFEGRLDDCFKIKGRWVTPIEVEERVLQHIPAISSCLLIEGQMENGIAGSVLFVETLHPYSTDILAREVHDALSTLETYKHPTCCHVMPHLPTNTNGKPDRNALRHRVPALLAQHST